ncbi:Tec1p LALA0_S09e03158g [Lachancea lanzarotensis]|uniref:LALA0S09e03158g1_1 n=1 Tax=Lachancea lanzarotensis TaxID=1245769 RepID=A0A0C7MV73_9SACH|nr:uncharacterized protein LALA0_S09e03158g [Lachancea lanzarotensis]CEP63816.1 LALA0S09e03158g1_1 [Lachancea lanzarotensis]
MPEHVIDIMEYEEDEATRHSRGVAGVWDNNDDEDDDDDDDEDDDGCREDPNNDTGTTLVNTGLGEAMPLHNVANAIARHGSRVAPRFASQLPVAATAPPPSVQHTIVPSSSSSSSAASSAALASTDIWSVSVENAFLAALRIIPKKGTAKIKLKERNYGRNELISLYIHHNLGEYRAKKQISSHIQVWKKSILNKLQNGSAVTPYETELLQLIEDGAAQSPENERIFHTVFMEILEDVSNGPIPLRSYGDSSVSSAASNASSSSPSQNAVVGMNMASERLQTMMNAPTTARDSHIISPGHVTGYGILRNVDGSGHTMSANSTGMRTSTVSEAITPLEYARRVYGNSRSYKCVPVNMHDYTYQHTPGSASPEETVNQQTILAAQEVAARQRQLIDTMYTGQPQLYGPPPTSADIESEQVDFPRYDLPSFVPSTAARPPDQAYAGLQGNSLRRPNDDRHSRAPRNAIGSDDSPDSGS